MCTENVIDTNKLWFVSKNFYTYWVSKCAAWISERKRNRAKKRLNRNKTHTKKPWHTVAERLPGSRVHTLEARNRNKTHTKKPGHTSAERFPGSRLHTSSSKALKMSFCKVQDNHKISINFNINSSAYAEQNYSSHLQSIITAVLLHLQCNDWANLHLLWNHIFSSGN